jgi:hemolysin activation/secretion protein
MRKTLAIGGIRARLRGGVALFICVSLIALPFPSGAQQAGHQPGYDPRQTERRLEPLQPDRDRAAKPAFQMPRLPRSEIHGDTKPLFVLRTVFVEGASAIPEQEIAATYGPYIGKSVSQTDLIAIAGAISDIYRLKGYHLSRAIVPPQNLKDGHLRIRVIEGSIAEIVLKGTSAGDFGVRPLLAPVVAEHPSQLKTLERQLLLVNDRPGVRVADVALEEIGKTSGRFRLVVTVETWHIYAAQAVDNLGSPAVGPWEVLSTTAFNSYLVAGDSLGLSLSTTPSAVRELQYGRLAYDAPIGSSGILLGGTALYSDVWPGDIRRLLNTHTVIETYGLRGTIVPLETRRSTLWLTGSFDFTDTWERDVLGIDYQDHLRTLSLTADYKLQDDLAGWNYLTLTLRQGLDGLGASPDWNLLTSRSGASPEFSLVDLSFTRFQKLSDIWSLKFSAYGQWASGPLLLSQQFYLGDAAYGPGYYSGDNGAFGSFEVRYDQVLPYKYLRGYQLYSFIDGGAVWNFESNGAALSLSSAGAGVRFFITEQTQAGFGVAVPLHIGTTATQISDVRFLFSLSNSFKVCPERPQMRCL